MENNAMIRLKGKQMVDGENFDMELVTEGVYQFFGNGCTVDYEETEVTGMENTKTNLTVDGSEVILTRSGANNSRLMFKSGQKYSGHYDTPYGAFTISVLSNHVVADIDAHGGRIAVDYLLEMDNVVSSANEFEMVITQLERT